MTQPATPKNGGAKTLRLVPASMSGRTKPPDFANARKIPRISRC